jgi:excisionase family DNA binding protein
MRENNAMTLAPNYLTPEEARLILRVSRNTLAAMIADGRIKAVDRRKPGGRYAKWLVLADSLYDPSDPAERLALGEIERGLGW